MDAGPYDSIEFTFSGGTLTDEQIKTIVLQKDELDDFRFYSKVEALSLLRPTLQARIKAGLESIKNGVPAYTEQRR